MKKNPISSSSKRSLLQKFGFGVKVIVGLEVAGLLGSYIVWKKMNTDRDFRFKVYQASPYLLNYYYGIGEKLGGASFREDDYRAWGVRHE